MLGRRREDLRELISARHSENMAKHEETMIYLRQRDDEFSQYRREARAREKRLDRLVEETREFNREILLRNEKVYTAVIAELEENTAQVKSSTEETRAQTQALLQLIDRFDERDDAAAA